MKKARKAKSKAYEEVYYAALRAMRPVDYDPLGWLSRRARAHATGVTLFEPNTAMGHFKPTAFAGYGDDDAAE